MLSLKSHIFVDLAFGKGIVLFYLLTETTAIKVGDVKSPAFFLCISE